MQLASLPFITGRNFFVCPRTVSNGAFEQSTIFEIVRENLFEEIEIGIRFGTFQSAPDYNKRRGGHGVPPLRRYSFCLASCVVDPESFQVSQV